MERHIEHEKCNREISKFMSFGKLKDLPVYQWPHLFPFQLRACDYGLYKPIVVGEFNEVRGGGMDIMEQFIHAYKNKYNGAWSWHAAGTGINSDTWHNQKRGISALAKIAEFHSHARINISDVPAVSWVMVVMTPENIEPIECPYAGLCSQCRQSRARYTIVQQVQMSMTRS